MPNGNIFKGNKKKKGRHSRKEEFAIFDEKTDQYAKVIGMQGGKHMTVQPASLNGETVHATISGKHHKKVWFKKDDYVVISITPNSSYVEVVGRVHESELKKVRAMFDKSDGTKDSSYIFDGEMSDSDEDSPKNNAFAQSDNDEIVKMEDI